MFEAMDKAVVRAGCDAIGAEYTAVRHLDPRQLSFLQELVNWLPAGARVLDVGCGAGVPITAWLSQYFAVTGIDIPEQQILLALT